MIFTFLFWIICFLVSVAFYTLLERKLLSYIQYRVGPNKVSFIGLLQPISDAVKLLIKSWFIPERRNKFLYLYFPIISFIIAVFLFLYFYISYFNSSQIGVIAFLIILALGVIPICIVGWSSNRFYRKLGGYRTLAQSISYEVCVFFLVLFPIILFSSINFFILSSRVFFLCILIYFILLIVTLAETNRAPFDLSEGERELVSGFNTEYRGSGFTILFLSEYAQIIIISLIISILFFRNLFNIIIGFLSIILILVIRGCYPRLRYDSLINFIWVIALPLVNVVIILCPLFII